MCLLLMTTHHPDYDLILLSNRDEYFDRPTAPLSKHKVATSNLSLTIGPTQSCNVISGQDLSRGGTWLALSEGGRFAALTNFHVSETPPPSPISRGHLPLSFLCSTLDAKEYVDALNKDTRINQVGGFSLLCGDLTKLENGAMVVGNQSSEIVTVLGIDQSSMSDSERGSGVLKGDGEFMCACELSNTSISTPWPKTRLGRDLLAATVSTSVAESWTQTALVDALFRLLSTDTLRVKETKGMRESIYIPPVELGTTWYGTRQQSVWLVKQKQVTLVEETLDVDGSRKRVLVDHDCS